MFLVYDSKELRWCLADNPWDLEKPWAWSSSCMDLEPLVAHGWQCSEGLEITINPSNLQQLPRSHTYGLFARDVAKADFKKPWSFTRYRCCAADNCPLSSACDWGLGSELELYGHLCLYHRNSDQYYGKHRDYWNQAVADMLSG